MVYKVVKNKVRSGNTIRKAKCSSKLARELNCNRWQSYIARSHCGQSPDGCHGFLTEGAFGEGDSMMDGVKYSLNKQRRWELPGVIEEIIKRRESDHGFHIELIERRNISRQANCTKFCRTSEACAEDGPITQMEEIQNPFVRTKSRGFFQAESCMKIENSKSSRKKRRRSGTKCINDQNLLEFQYPKIQYEVNIPVENTSYLQYHKPTFLTETESMGKHGFLSRQQKFRTFNQDCLDSQSEQICFNDEDELISEVPEQETRQHRNTLGDVFMNAENAHKLWLEDDLDTLELESSSSTTDPAELRSSDSWSNQSPIETVQVSGTPVILNRNDVTARSLLANYGHNYLECRCFPRKFILNITSRLHEQKFKSTHQNPVDGVCLVFVHDSENDVNTQELPVYRVIMKSAFAENIETLFDYMETNIEDIINRALFFLQSFPIVYETNTDQNKQEHSLSAGLVEQSYKWETNSYMPNDNFLIKYCMTEETNGSINETEELKPEDDVEIIEFEDDYPVQKPTVCPICCMDIYENVTVTCLRTCGHVICNFCWTDYITSNVISGNVLLKCPQFDCDIRIDSGTAMSFLSHKTILQYGSISNDNLVSVNRDKLWCCRKSCGRVLSINMLTCEIARCPCGQLTCPRCLEEAHWPADCESVKEYNKALLASGDKHFIETAVYATFHVHVKPCPHCLRSVEKFGGCNHMRCFCGKSFCWTCGEPWNSARGHNSCCGESGDRYRTQIVCFSTFDIDNDGVHREKWYKKAVEHRLNIQETKLSQLKKFAKSLLRPVRQHIQTQGTRITNSTTPNGNQADADQIVTSLVDLYVEVNKVAENASVVLNKWVIVESGDIEFEKRVEGLSKMAQVIWDLFDGDLNCGQPPIYIIRQCKKVQERVQKKLQRFIRSVRNLNNP